MKVNRSEIIESIKKLNKEKPLTEGAEIQRATLPADADALEQHEEALKANAERRNPDNYDKEVKELIKETASEESRYRHFDVVDRKDLAKKINEAKEKGLDFKVSKSTKEGFRYDLKVLNEEFIKKEAGDPEVNKDAFNKATDVAASSPTTGLGEDYTPTISIPGKELAYDLANWISEHEGDVLNDVKDYLLRIGYEKEAVDALFETGDFILEGTEKCPKCGKNPCECEKGLEEGCEELEEELKVFTSDLRNFHPSQRSESLWNEIKEANKIEDLEYALETLYPDGIGDVALDDMLSYEEEWIRDLIGLSENPVEEEPKVMDEFDDEDVEPVDEFEVEEEEDIEPVDFEDETEIEDDVEPVTDDEEVTLEDDTDALYDQISELPMEEKSDSVEEEPEVKEEEEEVVEESLVQEACGDKEVKEECEKSVEDDLTPEEVEELKSRVKTVEVTKEDETKNESLTEGQQIDVTEEEVSDIAEGFLKNNFKPNNLSEETETSTTEEVKQSLTEAEEDEEVVAVDDALVEDMLGLPKSEESKKD